MPYPSTFGQLDTSAKRAPATAETPFRLAVWGDFSGRQDREPPADRSALAGRKPTKINHDSLDEVIETIGPRLEFEVAGGEVSVSLEFSEFDDFHPDAIARQVDRVTDLEGEEQAALVREILHHPRYRELEATWRGLEWLLRRAKKGDRVQVVLIDATRDELAADLMASDSLAETAAYKLLIEKTAEGIDGQPWTAILGAYTFQETPEHVELLGRMSKIAARAGAPFLTGLDAAVAQEGYERSIDTKDAWLALGQLPESAYLGIAAPGFLVRPPFGENFRPAERLDKFEEFTGQAYGYLWCNSAFGCAALLAKGFMDTGWAFRPEQTLALDAMPMHAYTDADGETVGVTTQVRFTTAVSQELAARGVMPVMAVRGRDSVEFACIRSVSQEYGALAGRWQGGSGGAPVGSAFPKSSVGMMPAGKASGRPAPNREGPAAVSTAPRSRPQQSSDPEVDADLAALLGGGDSGGGGGGSYDSGNDSPPLSDSPPFDDGPPMGDSSPPAAAGGDEMLDPELAALLGGGDAPPAAAPAAEELDPELAALLGGGDASPAAAPPAEEALDPELAALLGETSSPSPSAAAEPAADALDPELAALLGEASPAATESAPPADSDALDPELAALLGGSSPSDEPPASDTPPSSDASPPTDDALDPELAALLGGDSPPEPPPSDEPPLDEPTSDSAPTDPNAGAEALDPELAALLGETTEPPASDPDLAALLDEPAPASAAEPLDELPAGLDAEESLAPAETAALPESPAEIAEVEAPMATITDDRPDLDEADASSSTRSVAAMAQDIDALLAEIQAASKYGAPGSGVPPTIPFRALLEPISEDEPAGGGVPYDVRERLEQMRKEINPEAFAPDDPLRPTDLVKADWRGIIELAQETLQTTSKNLLVVSRLLEALTKTYGFAGLRDGWHLFRLLIDICWDRLDPPLEDDDLEVRASPFIWLDDPDRGACFPNSLRAVPLLSAGGNQFSWAQWQQSQSGAESADVVERVVMAASREQCQSLVDTLSQAQQELMRLMQSLSAKLGGEAPGFTAIRPAMADCLKLAQQVLQRKGAPAPDQSAGVESGNGEGVTMVVAKPRFGTRDDIYQELAAAASALERLEPHSPVPFLVRRAVELGALPFPLLMQALIRDANVLTEMNRELGIKSPETPSA